MGGGGVYKNTLKKGGEAYNLQFWGLYDFICIMLGDSLFSYDGGEGSKSVHFACGWLGVRTPLATYESRLDR